MRFAPHTDDDVTAMLDALGLASVDDLFDQVPPEVRLARPLDLPPGISEQELLADLGALAGSNRSVDDLVCFAGAGAYDHYVPAAVWALAGRSEFATSYTPYQPELSQGVLQALFEYQSMVCELTSMEVSNASLYDGSTALVEAVNMTRAGVGGRVVLSAGVDPRHVETLATYGRGSGVVPEVLDLTDGVTPMPDLGDGVAAFVVQHPNRFGLLEDVEALATATHGAGAKLIHVFDPMSLGILRPPGELGADVAVAEGQPLGNHLAYGGPYLGLIAARMTDVRKMPGRIVGQTVDAEGRTGYVLTLQAREQHIRREKATSNICTNQGLIALASTIYMSLLGKHGLRQVSELCYHKAHYAARQLAAIPGYSLWSEAPFFHEFVLKCPAPVEEINAQLLDYDILGGYDLGQDYPELENHMLVAVTEMNSKSEIDMLVEALQEVSND